MRSQIVPHDICVRVRVSASERFALTGSTVKLQDFYFLGKICET